MADPANAGILIPADSAEDGHFEETSLAIPDVFTGLEFINMKVTGDVGEVPVHYSGAYVGFSDPDRADVGYVCVLMISLTFRKLGSRYYRDWDDWCELDVSDDSCDFCPKDGDAQSPFPGVVSVTTMGEEAMPARLQRDSLRTPDFSTDIDPGPGVDFLELSHCRGPTVCEDFDNMDGWGCPRDFGGSPSPSDLDVSSVMGSDMWPLDTVIVLSGQDMRVWYG